MTSCGPQEAGSGRSSGTNRSTQEPFMAAIDNSKAGFVDGIAYIAVTLAPREALLAGTETFA